MDKLSNKQAISLLTMSLLGSAMILNGVLTPGIYAYISILIAGVISAAIYLMYADITKNFQRKNLLEIFKAILGRKTGRVFAAVFALFSLLAAGVHIRGFCEFVTAVSLVNTDIVFIILVTGVLAVYLANRGIGTMGRFCTATIPLIFLLIILTGVFSLGEMDTGHLRAADTAGTADIFNSSLMILCSPLLEAAFFIGIFNRLKTPEKANKIYLVSLLIMILTVAFSSFRNTTLLGTPTLNLVYFPSYVAVGIGSIGSFLERIEILVSTVFLICVIVKTGVILYIAFDCANSLFPKASKKISSYILGALSIAASAFWISNITKQKELNLLIILICIVFFVVIPLVLFLVYKVRRLIKHKL